MLNTHTHTPHSHTHTHTHTYTHARTHAHAHTHIHTHTHTHEHTYIHTHAHARTHIHTHAHDRSCNQNFFFYLQTCLQRTRKLNCKSKNHARKCLTGKASNGKLTSKETYPTTQSKYLMAKTTKTQDRSQKKGASKPLLHRAPTKTLPPRKRN